MTTSLEASRPSGVGATTPNRAHVALRVAFALALIGVAYHHTFAAIFSTLTTDTPLAYLGLVPLLVLGVALVKGRPSPDELRLPDRQVDWIIGVPLLVVALLIAVVLPGRLSYTFWTNRFDVLGLPFFVAGVVAILFGSRVLYRIRVPIVLLFLAWPFPYERVVERVLSISASFALWGVRKGLPLVGGADAVSGSVFRLGEEGRQFSVNVAPTCAGANSVLGFLLVGGAVALVLKGRRRSKLAWLAVGVVLMAVLNVGRLLLLFWTGNLFGEEVMLNTLHPFAGLAFFIVGCLLMIGLLPVFGISTPPPREGSMGAAVPLRVSSPPTVYRGLAVLVTLSAVLGAGNASLRRFDPFWGVRAAGTSVSASDPSLSVAGWSGTRFDEVTWARQYFGKTSTWHRHNFTRRLGSTGSVASLFMDVVNAADVKVFSTYGLEDCYRFHGFDIVRSERVDVGAAAEAQAITYLDKATRKGWAVVAWVSPVRGQGADKRFERVVLLASVDARRDAAEAGESATGELVAFARSLVAEADKAGSRR